MPLKNGKSRKIVSKNIRTEMPHGKRHEQAEARECDMARKSGNDILRSKDKK